MAFRTTTNKPRSRPKVTVTFGGLLILKPNSDNGCDIGINRFSDGHFFQLLVLVDEPCKPLTVMRIFSGTPTGDIGINASPRRQGVRIFTGNEEEFDRENAANSALDFRWALDLGLMHEHVDFNDGARPVATLNEGTLYSSKLTREGLNPTVHSLTDDVPLNRFASDLAAAINLPTDGKVTLTWDDFGVPRSIDLPDPRFSEEATYTIALINQPPGRFAPEHDEITLYYRVMEVAGQPIDPANRCRLEFVSVPSTDEVPCMPVIINS